MSRRPVLGLFPVSRAGIAFLALIGTVWAYQRGGGDFAVFYQASLWVLKGQADLVYRSSPDQFLYAPGFAWLMTPFALLPIQWALGAWCAIKALAVAYTLARVASSDCVAALALAFIARPLLIDFQYGQVNLILLCAIVWAIHGPQDRIVSWIALSWAAVAKLIALPLLSIPWLEPRMARRRWATALGGGILLLLPIFTLGWTQGSSLLLQWKQALKFRGLPLESHNQSFASFLHHYFSGQPTRVIALYAERDYSLPIVLEPRTLSLLASAWSAAGLGILTAWVFLKRGMPDRRRWAAVAVALLIVPSHLVWKPYFVMALPVAAVAVSDALVCQGRQALGRWGILAIVFLLLNLSGFDFVGSELAARLEASSVLLFSHLALTSLAAFGPAGPRGRHAA